MRNIFLSLGSNLGDRGDFLQRALESLEKWGVSVLRTSSIYEAEAVGERGEILKDAAGKAQPGFLNMVIEVETERSPEDLLMVIHAIERALGRERGEARAGRQGREAQSELQSGGVKSSGQRSGAQPRFQPRTIDLDILFFGDLVYDFEKKIRTGPEIHVTTEKVGFANDACDQVAHARDVRDQAASLIIPHPRLQERKFVLIPMTEIAPDFVHPVLKKSMQELLKECPDKSIVTVLR
ncbi:MAG: 2-amino-4-hydroxy-6-hydroxymethyldihydropteridine diphosphokinase [Candidatus Gracilibacteria bacterium]|jgi:2-amino-4-hydroxy-6-hydroxymethyldihydropteridine diphosphokinase